MMRRSTPVSSRTPAAGNRSRDLTSFWHPCPALALLAAAIVFVTCLRLGHLPLLNPDEGRNAEIGREMKESGAWLVPTYNGVVRLDKPTFYFKTVALSLAAFGETETAARLPSALFGLGLLGLVVAFCQRVYGTPTALLAVIVLATMPLYLAQARTVMVDIALERCTSPSPTRNSWPRVPCRWRRLWPYSGWSGWRCATADTSGSVSSASRCFLRYSSR